MTTDLNLHPHVWLPQDGATHTVVALHGTGGDEHDLVPLVRDIYPTANILGIRGNVSEGGANRFFRRFAEGMFDIDDLKARADVLVRFWTAAQTAYGLRPENATWLGYSNGANMIAALLMTTDVVRKATLLRAQHPGVGEGGSAAHPAQVLLMSGEYDTLIPIAGAMHLRDDLTARGHTVVQRLLPTGHQLSHMDLSEMKDLSF